MTRTAPAPGDFRPSDLDHTQASATSGGSGGGRVYVSTWAIVGLASAGYLGFMALNGDGTMQRTLASLQDDVRGIKRSVVDIDARERATLQRIDTMESRIGAISASASGLSGPQAVQQASAPQAPSVAPPSYPGIAVVTTRSAPPPVAVAEQPVAANEPQRPTRIIAQVPQSDDGAAKTVQAAVQPKVIRVPQPKANDAYGSQPIQPSSGWAIDTGSTTPAPAKPTGPRGVQIGTGPSLDAMKLNWTVLSQAHSPVLGALEPRIAPSTDGRAFRLLAGPFASDAEAQKACAQLKARGVSCRSTDYNGAPL